MNALICKDDECENTIVTVGIEESQDLYDLLSFHSHAVTRRWESVF